MSAGVAGADLVQRGLQRGGGEDQQVLRLSHGREDGNQGSQQQASHDDPPLCPKNYNGRYSRAAIAKPGLPCHTQHCHARADPGIHALLLRL